ncbi:hypothetical protein E1295_40645 [Nonomuraea mesophila]|uniref:Uncharacterized protein n=1 Tax=Nonomuraea mesophila TaxID=2530382 RepID=A0A4R5EC30_9ACTN|nr:hypothetical protein [Nonomuraea mesophila]TDE30906.1 hypothetical protein E1295_40645 [Nonomuraea mesophila]
MSTIRDFRRDTPPMTAQAESAARARLLAAAREPEPRREQHPEPLREPRTIRQAAIRQATTAGDARLVTRPALPNAT